MATNLTEVGQFFFPEILEICGSLGLFASIAQFVKLEVENLHFFV